MSMTDGADPVGMVLAAGFGTRLGPLGDERPKALLPVCNRPLYHYAFELLSSASIRRVVVNTHNMAELVEETISSDPAGMEVLFSREEPEILGTGGGVKAASRFFDNRPVVVVNAKLVTDLDLMDVVEAHRRSGALATMVVRPDPDARAWGAVEVDGSGMVRGIAGMRDPSAPSDLDPFMFTGIAVLEPEFLAVLPDGPSCIVRQGYHAHLRAGRSIGAFVHRGYWHEHSTPSRYLRGNFNLLEGKGPVYRAEGKGPVAHLSSDAIVGQGVEFVEPYLVGAGARIEDGARVGPHVVLGQGARVAAKSRVARAVVWDGAEVTGHLDGAVVTGRQVVDVDLADEGAKTGPALGSKAKRE